jgi:dTDP-glucose 4,6-dehydratase/UDP-glucuronate decarboxylase
MVCVDNLRSGVGQRVAHLMTRPDFVLVEHDITMPLQWKEEVRWIIHGASIASPVLYRRFPLQTIAVNVDGTRHLLDLGRRLGVQSLLYLSSSEVYGDPDPDAIPTPETYPGRVSCTGPRACYDESKRLAETLCMVYHRLHGVPVKVVRPFNVYGPGQRLDDQRIIPDLMTSAVRRTPIILYSDGRATRSFCYISDALKAMWHVLLSDCNGEVFNVGNDREEVTILEAARCLQEIVVDPPLEIQFQTSPDADYLRDNPSRRCPDLTKLRSEFPWEPCVMLKEGLAHTLAHYLEERGKDLNE